MGHLKTLIDKALITNYQLAQISGLSHAYISMLDSGKISKYKKDKLVFIGVALNLSIDDINKLLNYYDFESISENDVPLFINAAKRRKIIGLQPLYDNIGFDLLLLSLERLNGDEIIVSDRITNRLSPPKYAIYKELHRKGIEDILYLKIKSACVEKRKKIFYKTLRKYRIHHLVCEECLKNYIKHFKENKNERDFIITHFSFF